MKNLLHDRAILLEVEVQPITPDALMASQMFEQHADSCRACSQTGDQICKVGLSLLVAFHEALQNTTYNKQPN